MRNTSYNVSNYQQHLEQLKYFDSKDGKIAYIDCGEGKPILLVHGIPTSSWLYRKLVPLLLQKGYRVIIPDLLGFGASDKPNDVECYQHQKQGERLLKLMQHLNIKSWTHVCHDGGGVWTWEMLKKNPSGVKQLIILNTILYREGFKPPMIFSRGLIAKLYTKLYCSKLFGKMMIKATMKNGLFKHQLSKDELEGYLIPMFQGAHTALYYFFTSLKQVKKDLPSYQEMLQELAIPTKVIWGGKDKILQAKQVPFIQTNSNIPDKYVKVLENTGHFLQEKGYAQVVGIIAENS